MRFNAVGLPEDRLHVHAAWAHLIRRGATSVVAAGLLIGTAPLLRPSLASGAAYPEEQDPETGANAPIESIRVSAIDDSGAPITGLSSGDFVVTEDGERRQIVSVEGREDDAVDVVLVLDESYSMMPARWRDFAIELLGALSPQRDRVLLVRFAGDVRSSAWLRPDDPALAAAIEATERSGGSSLFDALAEAMRQLFASPPRATPGRNMAIVAITDGADTSSTQLEADRLEMAVQAMRAPIFHIDSDLTAQPPGIRTGILSTILDFERLVSLSGGKTLDVRSRPLEKLFARLRYSYSVSYRTADSDPRAGRYEFARHEVEIEIPSRSAELLHRPFVYRPALDAEVASTHLDEARDLFAAGRGTAARAAIDRSIAANPYIAAAHGLRARILASVDALAEALESATHATELEPATTEYHRLASDLARQLARYEIAWEHAIRAAQLDDSANDILDTLADITSPPADLNVRLSAPRVVVAAAPPAQPDLLVRAALPGAIVSIQRALSESPAVGLIADPALAGHVVWVVEKDLSASRPREFEGRVVLTDRSGEELYDEEFTLEDIDDPATNARDLARHVDAIVEKVTGG